MRTNITARHFKLQEDLKTFVEEEVFRLKKYYTGIIDADVILSWEKFHRLAEIQVNVYGVKLKAEERSEDMKKSVTLAVDKLERQVIKYKERLHHFEHEKTQGQPIVEQPDPFSENQGEGF
jgi:putative sigma-54 modulation protein